MLKTHLFRISFVSWMVFITWSSLYYFDSEDLPKWEVPHLDKAVHFTYYFVAVVLGAMAVREFSKGLADYRKTLIYTCATMVLFGTIIEVIQYALTFDREGDIFDGLANALGAFSGVWATNFLFSRKRKLNWKQ